MCFGEIKMTQILAIIINLYTVQLNRISFLHKINEGKYMTGNLKVKNSNYGIQMDI